MLCSLAGALDGHKHLDLTELLSDDPASAAPVPTSRRRPWLAALLSLFLTGLGHTYAGRPARGAALWLATFVVGLLAFFFIVVLPSAPALVVFIILLLGPPIAVAVAAWRVARGSEPAYELHWYNRWYWYLAALVLASFVVQPRVKSFL